MTSLKDRYLEGLVQLKLIEQVLYQCTTIDGQKYGQLIVPLAVNGVIYDALHDDMGRQGREGTSWLIKTRIFWVGIAADSECYVVVDVVCDRKHAMFTRQNWSISHQVLLWNVCYTGHKGSFHSVCHCYSDQKTDGTHHGESPV